MLRLKRFLPAADKVSFARAKSADQALLDSETFSRVQRVVKTLLPKYREPVVLKYLQELPDDQIRQLLGLSENALQVRLNRARKHLQEKLKDLIE